MPSTADVRHISGLTLECAESAVEYISLAPEGASCVVFGGLLRAVDDGQPDPKVRLVRDRRVADGALTETWTVASHLPDAVRVALRLRLRPDDAPLHEVKAGLAGPADSSDAVSTAAAPDVAVTVLPGTSAPGRSAP